MDPRTLTSRTPPTPAPATGPAGSSRLVPLVCWAALATDGYDLFAYGATLPSIIAGPPWHVGAAAGGAVGSLALVGVLLGSLVAGTLTDVLGRRRLVLACTTLLSVAMALSALAPTFALFGAARFVTGIGIGGLLPTAIALASESADPRYRSRVLGAVLTGPAVGGVLAALAALVLLPEHGFRAVYLLGAAPLVLVVPLAAVVLRESPEFLAARAGGGERPAAGAGAAVAGLFRGGTTPGTLGLWVVNLCSLLATFGFSTWLPQIMRSAGFELGSAISFLLVYNAGAIAGTLLAAALAERLGAKVMVLTGFATAAAALLVLATTPPGWALLLLVAVTGFGGLGTQNMINDHVAGFYPARLRATGLGWALGVGRLGAIAGPTYGAVLVGAGASITAAALAFAVPVVVGAAVMASVPRRSPAAVAGPAGPASR
ncbi:MFS transporter [Kineococcus glutinatus]|uniref:Aromatic acid/H+ symport family MFS transporter n=1 Tax=Kineococcus glutinatus TaxID=1070872 RepID=A0ABP9I2V2_9ACTN